MKRVEHEAKPSHIVISRKEYETDKERGYCILERNPPSKRVIKNPRDPNSELTIDIKRSLMFRCMKCQFDVLDGDYAKGNGLDKIKEHVWRNNHPWLYTPFTNPYGNVADVTIEGIEDYTEEI